MVMKDHNEYNLFISPPHVNEKPQHHLQSLLYSFQGSKKIKFRQNTKQWCHWLRLSQNPHCTLYYARVGETIADTVVRFARSCSVVRNLVKSASKQKRFLRKHYNMKT